MEYGLDLVFVYILELSEGRYYTGITKNLFKRVEQHCNKKSKYTSRYEVLRVKYVTLMPSRKIARGLEVKIKMWGAKRYMNNTKFEDRYELNIAVKDILCQDNQESVLNQLLIIREKRIFFDTPPLK